MDEGGVEVDGKSDEAMLKVICKTDAGGMNHVIRVVPSDVLSSYDLLICNWSVFKGWFPIFCLLFCSGLCVLDRWEEVAG